MGDSKRSFHRITSPLGAEASPPLRVHPRMRRIIALAMLLAGTAHAQDSAQLGDPAIPPPPSEIPAPPHLALDITNLDGWLDVQSERAEGSRVEGSVWQLVLGALSAGLGLWLMLDTDTFGSVPSASGLGAVGMGLGLWSMGSGIFGLASSSFERDRRQRWRRALAGGLDERELGRFEGELRAEAELGRFLRGVEVTSGFVQAGAGLAMIFATALASFDVGGQAIGYPMGGTFVLTGLISALTALFVESTAEREWRRYREGHGPDDNPAPALSLTPGGARVTW